jgi:RNA polymerase sigma factor (sigma-70 family)
MLPSGLASFRQLPRAGDEAVAIGNIEKRLQRRVRAPQQGRSATGYTQEGSLAEEMPMWQEPQASPEKMIVRRQDTATIRRLVAELPEPFREAIVLREMNNLSYQEIAQVAGVPVGTVMSRLARGRAMLRAAWNAAENATTRSGPAVASGTPL